MSRVLMLGEKAYLSGFGQLGSLPLSSKGHGVIRVLTECRSLVSRPAGCLDVSVLRRPKVS